MIELSFNSQKQFPMGTDISAFRAVHLPESVAIAVGSNQHDYHKLDIETSHGPVANAKIQSASLV